MRGTNDLKSRGDIIERSDVIKADISKSESDLEIIAKDVEIIRDTLKKLDFGSTTREGSDEIDQHIETAEDVTKEEFNKEDDVLENKQDDNVVLEKNLTGRNESSEKNLAKVSDIKTAIKTKESLNEMNKAQNAVIKDIDFLLGQIDKATKERERSDQVQKQLQERIK